MSKDLSANKPDLVIVSDTTFVEVNKELIAFEATLREIEFLTKIFNRIRWIGFIRPDYDIKDARKPNSNKIELIGLKEAGGDTIWDKLEVISKLPYYYFRINKELKAYTYVHTRAPSTPAMLTILKSIFDKKRKYWHKYAGNWKQKNPPLTYRLNISLMKKAKNTFVAINGKWENQKPHIKSFQNPCFSEAELTEARNIRNRKDFFNGLNLCFVGRIVEQKGIGRIIEALRKMKYKYDNIYIVGGGEDQERFEREATKVDQNILFKGKMPRKELNKIYADSHILCLPTWVSEGFPKVIAEAAAFGCVSVVSSVSSITHYIKNDENGFVLKNLESNYLAQQLDMLFENRDKLKRYSYASDNFTDLFTYEHYNSRILNEFIR